MASIFFITFKTISGLYFKKINGLGQRPELILSQILVSLLENYTR